MNRPLFCCHPSPGDAALNRGCCCCTHMLASVWLQCLQAHVRARARTQITIYRQFEIANRECKHSQSYSNFRFVLPLGRSPRLFAPSSLLACRACGGRERHQTSSAQCCTAPQRSWALQRRSNGCAGWCGGRGGTQLAVLRGFASRPMRSIRQLCAPRVEPAPLLLALGDPSLVVGGAALLSATLATGPTWDDAVTALVRPAWVRSQPASCHGPTFEWPPMLAAFSLVSEG